MPSDFAEKIKVLRIKNELSQQQLADMVLVNRSTITNWETGRRIPDIIMIKRLAECLGVHVNTLLEGDAVADEKLEIIVVDDEKIVLSDSMEAVERVFPHALIAGFTRASEAIEYARARQIGLAFLDVEIGIPSGLDLCRELLAINPETNVVFLTAYESYALKAWDTGACGFLLKPLTAGAIRRQLSMLRHPLPQE